MVTGVQNRPPCLHIGDKSAGSVFCSDIWSLTSVPDTGLLKLLEFPGW